jgi:hypothetical protein
MANYTAGPTEPDWLNAGDNAWQLSAATFVGLQSLPGLVVLYAGEFRAIESWKHLLMMTRHCQDQMGHQFGLHGHLRVRSSHGVLGCMGLPDGVRGANDSRSLRNT